MPFIPVPTPLFIVYFCCIVCLNQITFLLNFCSSCLAEALPPPTLSLSKRETASRVYVRTEESATLECIFQSSINEFVRKSVFLATFDRVSVFAQSNIIAFLFQAYITLTRDGNDLYTERTLPGHRVTWILRNTVNEGEYACYVHTRGFKVYRTESSNVIGIYSTYHFYTIPPISDLLL